MSRYTVTNFSRGEFGPQLFGRVDVPQYSAGAKELTNFIVQRYGGVAFRPGFRFVGEVDDKDVDNRFLPFQFSIDQAYVLLLEDSFQRVLALGGFVTLDNLEITAITKAAHGQLTVAYHDLVVGDRLYLDGIAGMVELNNRFTTVHSVVDANNFTIEIDTTGYTTFVSSDGNTRTGAPAAPPAPESPPPDPTPSPPPPDVGGGGGDIGTGGPGTFFPRGTQIP